MASSPTTTKIGHALAKVLGIKLQYRNPTGEVNLTRGESVFSVSTADTYVEEVPSSLEWIRQIAPTGRTFVNWVYDLFPFTHWIGRYNGTWLIGDLVAGQPPLTCSPQVSQLTLDIQVSLWDASSFLSRWRMPNWPSSLRSLVCIHHSWVS